jgi:holo-[acyl-carrier protein] synthase
MQVRTGIDLVQISRIRESVEKFGDRFLQRIFTEAELEYALSSPPHRDARLAARFAAKEAVLKVLRVDNSGINFRQIEVVRHSSGAVDIALHGTAKELADAAELGEFSLSLSHDGDYATAIVVALGKSIA